MQHVMVSPNLFPSCLGEQVHDSTILTIATNPLQILVKQWPDRRDEEVSEVTADHLLRLVPEGTGRRGIHRQQLALYVVSTNQAQTVLHEVAIPLFALLQGLGCALKFSEPLLILEVQPFDALVYPQAHTVDQHGKHIRREQREAKMYPGGRRGGRPEHPPPTRPR